jgi:hypothetical protein
MLDKKHAWKLEYYRDKEGYDKLADYFKCKVANVVKSAMRTQSQKIVSRSGRQSKKHVQQDIKDKTRAILWRRCLYTQNDVCADLLEQDESD